MKKRVICLAALVLFLFTGCGILGAKVVPKTFTHSSGISIELTNAFWESEYEGYIVCYDSGKMAVFALKGLFSEVGQEYTLAEYARIVVENNNAQVEIVEKDGLTCFVFSKELEEGNYTYFASVYKGADAYWMLQFGCKTEDYEGNKEQIELFAKSVKV